ncbi:acyclic terpene utilization AtuA family protein [Actinoalloteichus hymeniacidonis]|uniref:acyclic terpene utilization AtuA family protein n=1 Tax=Actinoalloteichus hymeniacidonis TaxID=340345 RepID=UPI000852F4E6|nr:acyclic terpene utilization AtuA family protein [Actinoalloteichus hymeniacidonis]
MTNRRIRLGAGAGFAGDRIDPARDLAERGELDYLIFECLGERTVAAGQAQRLRDPNTGYDPLLAARMRAVLAPVLAAGTTVVTNSGSANPLAAAEVVADCVRDLGVQGPEGRPVRIATVTGDDVLAAVRTRDPVVWETGRRLSEHSEELVSANAYLGSDAVLPALARRPDVVLTGRLADPALYLAPLLHEFGWGWTDHVRLGAGTAIGHLLECAGQLTGGYYADPGTKPVDDLAFLGFPFAEVAEDGTAEFGKLDGTGGLLTARTCAEQLLYEVGDPAAYLTPDVTADFRDVRFREIGPNRVAIEGATGRARPNELKVTLGFRGGWLGEGQISYAGPRALGRARLAAEVVTRRLVALHGVEQDAVTVEFIGAGAAFRGLVPIDEDGTVGGVDLPEVRLRVSATVGDRATAEAIGWEVEGLYTNGPAGGGGARRSTTEVLAVRSCLLPRELVHPEVHIMDVAL